MKKTILYAIVVLVVLAILVIGWYSLSAQAMATASFTKCTRWKCTDIKTYTCPAAPPNYTTNNTCLNGVLSCSSYSESYVTKDYVVIENGIAYQNITNVTLMTGIYTINNETVQVREGHTWTLSDGIIFGVTVLSENYTAFYLQSTIETKSSSLYAPYPKSTTVNLKIGKARGGGGTALYCSNWYLPSCSGETLTCSLSGYYCSSTAPSTKCVKSGTCKC